MIYSVYALTGQKSHGWVTHKARAPLDALQTHNLQKKNCRINSKKKKKKKEGELHVSKNAAVFNQSRKVTL